MTEDRIAAKRAARDAQKAKYLRGMADRYAAQFRAAAGRGAVAVASEAHAAISEVLDRELGKSPNRGAIRCHKGCSHCCHEPVEIWPQEAALLAQAAREAGVAIDRERLERQCRHTIATWKEQPRADRACVFLGADGACRVYASRPNACRKLLVVSDPALCDADRHAPDEVERWLSWESEMLETAALETFGRGLLPHLVQAELNAK